MTKNTTKKAESTPAKAPEPMDPAVFETAEGRASTNTKRNAYALVQLVSEVRALWPEASYEFTDYNGRNTALGVSFDLTSLDDTDRDDFVAVLALTSADIRVNEVLREEDQMLILLAPSARTQDNRDPFGLDRAYSIMTEGDSL